MRILDKSATVLPVPTVVAMLLPLVQQARTPREQHRVLHAVPTPTALSVLPIVTILPPLALQARMPVERLLVLHVQ